MLSISESELDDDGFYDEAMILCRILGSSVKSCIDQRRHLVTTSCSKSPHHLPQKTLQELFKQLRVSDHYKMVFCDVPLVGDIKMNSIYELLTDPVISDKLDNNDSSNPDEVFVKYGLKTLLDYPKDEQIHILQTFQKVMIVQNPVDKLHAIFKNKYPIVLNPSNHQRVESFSDFIDYRIADVDIVDHALMTYNNLCQPCFVNYTAILKMESMATDVLYLSTCLLGETNPDMLLDSIDTFQYINQPSAKEYWNQLRKDQLRNISLVYADDMKMFSYSNHMDMNGEWKLTSDEELPTCK